MAQPCSEPREYGPEFNVSQLAEPYGGACIDLDDHYLPHIDPLLTIKTHDSALAQQHYAQADPNTHNWEPLITKVYHAYDDSERNRLSILNTDIF